MKASVIIGVTFALVLHAGFILFGGLLFPEVQKQNVKENVVYLPDPEEEKEKPKDPEPEPEKVKSQEEPPPDAEKVIHNMEADDAAKAPALELASLAAINDALSGKGGDGGILSFGSGGVVGGTGKFGATGKGESDPFSLDDLDQKPRAIFQASPAYPAEMRGQKIEGVVSVLFVVDPTGKVTKQRIDKSNNVAFEKPALEAVRQWKFEPALKGGQRVACKMRVSVRFPAS